MIFNGVSHFLLLLLISACALAIVPLEISRDVTGNRYYHWSSAKHFDATFETVSSQLPALAKQAHEEMTADMDRLAIKGGSRPAAMAALAVGSDVYFSSSLKGPHFILQWKKDVEPSPINPKVALELYEGIQHCQHAYESKDHGYTAKCAELLAIQAYLVNNKGAAPLEGRAAVSTYGLRRDAPIGVKAPCALNTKGQWGCEIPLNHLGIVAIGKEGDDPDKESSVQAQGPRLPNCYWT
ncbi:hypothetical protein LTR95_011604 [Oleoguttula sp. CCFEE 5521]